jgi:hypothetical protein
MPVEEKCRINKALCRGLFLSSFQAAPVYSVTQYQNQEFFKEGSCL